MVDFKFKNDKYRNIRGGHARLLKIECEKCGAQICHYQKDGPGNLRRMYIDRVVNSKVSLYRKDLSCQNGHLIGVKVIYAKEKRPAFRLFVDAVVKKIVASKRL